MCARWTPMPSSPMRRFARANRQRIFTNAGNMWFLRRAAQLRRRRLLQGVRSNPISRRWSNRRLIGPGVINRKRGRSFGKTGMLISRIKRYKR